MIIPTMIHAFELVQATDPFMGEVGFCRLSTHTVLGVVGCIKIGLTHTAHMNPDVPYESHESTNEPTIIWPTKHCMCRLPE
jgi:hypothetical protein